MLELTCKLLLPELVQMFAFGYLNKAVFQTLCKWSLTSSAVQSQGIQRMSFMWKEISFLRNTQVL